MTRDQEDAGAAKGPETPDNQPGHAMLRQRIGVRLLAYIVLFSSMVTLVSTLTQLYFDYRQQVGVIEHRLDEIERGYARSLAAGLWNVDPDQLRLQLEGIVHQSDMRAASVREIASGGAKPLVVTAGRSQDRSALAREVPLIYTSQGIAHQVGVFRLEATLDDVYDRLFNTAVIILISQGIKTFLVSLFILYIFHRLVMRHIVAITRFLDRREPHGEPPVLALERTPPAHSDELDRLVEAFNTLYCDLFAANRELTGVNAELERDIANRLAKEQEMRQMIDELVEANRKLDRFAYVASHDLKEPLRGIISYVELLARNYAGKLDKEADDYIRFVVTSARRMHDLINGLLNYSRATAKEAQFAIVSTHAACQAAIQNLHESIAQAQATVTIGDLPKVVGDEIQLMEVFQNLIGNAIKFRRPDVTPVVTVGVEPIDGAWRFAVADNGIGIHGDRPDVFEVFRQLHAKSEFPGTGVGLAICKVIVERHGGQIWYDSPPGQGTIFYFTLPRR